MVSNAENPPNKQRSKPRTSILGCKASLTEYIKEVPAVFGLCINTSGGGPGKSRRASRMIRPKNRLTLITLPCTIG